MADTMKELWDELREEILSGVIPNRKGNLLPKTSSQTEQIILLELAREAAISDGMALAELQERHDFAEWVGDRRPDPSRDQWLWVYHNIGVRHPKLDVDKVVGIMAGRDALLPFLRSAPDLRFVECYEKFVCEKTDDDAAELPYPQLEEAIKSDIPAKLDIFRIMCRNVADEELLTRAVYLKKPAVVCALLKKMSPEQAIPMLIKKLRHWKDPEKLIIKAVESFGADLAAWRDDFGNGFFWYLYARDQPVSKARIDALPDEVIATWEQPNRYGITAYDLWKYYRAGLQLPER